MTSLDPSPLIVALVQVATSLPLFLLAIPAGALSDIVDRRKYLMAGELCIMGTCIVFAVLVTRHLITPASLLLMTFHGQCGFGHDGTRLAGGGAGVSAKIGAPRGHCLE
jgi:MFS family permease